MFVVVMVNQIYMANNNVLWT